MRVLISLLLVCSLLCSLLLLVGAVEQGRSAFVPPVSAPTEKDHESAVEYVPTLADATLRSGRGILRETAANWDKYLVVQERPEGLEYGFTKALSTVFEGISRPVCLDGLRLRFQGLKNRKDTTGSYGTFAISFGKGEYDRFAFGLILDPFAGSIQLAQGSGSSLHAVGEPVLVSPLLTASYLESKEWSLTLSKEFDGSYTLTFGLEGEALSASIAGDLVEQGDYDPENCYVNIMAQSGLPDLSLILAGIAQLPRPVSPSPSQTLLRGTGNYSDTVSDWEKWLTVTEGSRGLLYSFTDGAHSVTEAFREPVSLKGLRLHFSHLSTTAPTKNGRFAVTFGTGSLVRSCFGLVFDFKAGKIYAANAEVSNGTVSTGRVSLVGSPLFTGTAFTYSALSGKEWYVDFSQSPDGNYLVTLCIEGTSYTASVPASVVCAYEGFNPESCILHLMSAQNGTTLDIQLDGIVNRYPESKIDNSDLLPAHIPATQATADAYGTPDWFRSAIMMEVNIPRITPEGTLDAAVSVLDHIAQTGVNCIWLTSMCEPGIQNSGNPGNHYTNKGLQTLDPAITGCSDYEEGYRKLADFVEEAHKRNIYVIFNVITWGTTADSPLYQEHPDWYSGADLWNGKAWDWKNKELQAWFQETLVDIVTKTNVDGVLYDCEPQYAGISICAQHRAAIRATGRNLVFISETVNERSDAFDMELYGVMDYSNYTETWLAIGDHQKDDREFFIDEGNNIVDAVKTGSISGTPAQQKAGTGGQYRYYSYSFSNHDSYYYAVNRSLLDLAYQGLFSSYIPIWYLGEEFNSTHSGIRLYFDSTNWSQLSLQHNRDFFEDLKSLLRIRREYEEVFEYMPENHRQSNICKVETTGSLDLQAYGRYYDNRGILIVGNHNSREQAVQCTVTVPFEAMGLSKYDHFTLTDLRSGELLCVGSQEDVATFTVQIPYDDLGVYAIEGTGTLGEGLTLARPEHALLRNGTAHEVNTATVNWSPYVQVEEAPYGKGLRFSFTKAVSTTGEGIKVPVSLDSLRICLDNLKGYENHGSTPSPSTIALSFGSGGYNRNDFGLIFDFENGKVYGAKKQAGTADRFVKDSAPLLEHEALTAEALKNIEWSIQTEKQEDGSYLLSLSLGDTLLQGSIPAEYIRKTDSFDPTHCYLYFTSYGQYPTVSFDLVGWGEAVPAYTPFTSGDIDYVNQPHVLSLAKAVGGSGLSFRFKGANALTRGAVKTRFCLDGSTLYFDDLSSYEDYSDSPTRPQYAIAFRTEEAHPYDLAIVMDPVYGTVSLALRGKPIRQLLSNGLLSYYRFRDAQWEMGFRKQEDGSYVLRISLPSGSFEATITAEELASIPEFKPENCALSLMSWQGDLKLSLSLLGYTTERTPAPLVDPNLQLRHSLELASDISVNLVLPKSLLEGFDMRTVYVESTMDLYEGNENTDTATLTLYPTEAGGYYYFTLDSLTAVQMNDKISSVLYGMKDGQSYCSPVDEYSIATYAYSQLNKTGIDNSLKTLCADLLRYGSKAQIYKAYRADSLGDSAMTEAQKAYLSDLDTVTFGNTEEILKDLSNAPITWAGKSMDLASRLALKFVFKPNSYSGKIEDLSLRVSYEDMNGDPVTLTVTESELYSESLNYYSFTVDSLLASELRSVVDVQIYEGNTPLSCTLRYSADTYGKNKTGPLADLCKALMAYSDSAKAYFHS